MDLRVVTFAEARQPEFKEKKGEGYIQYGDRNDYPNYLVDLFNKSAKHNAIIKSKVHYISANGWKGSEAAEPFIEKVNRMESLNDLTRKVSLDAELFGGYYLEIIFSSTGQLSEIWHCDYTKIRTNKDNTQFWYKEDWNDRIEKAQVYPAFNPANPFGKQILYVKEYRPNMGFYSLPGYFGALNYIESDIEISKHVLGNAQTGFSASKFINFYNGEPDEKKKAGIQARLENAATGAEGKKLLIAFNNDPAKKPTIDDLGASDMTKEDFTQVDNLITNNIITGHNVTNGMLFAIQQEGKLGGATELKTAFEIFKSTYVNYKQRNIETLVKYFSKVAGIDVEYKIKDIVPVGIELNPLDFKELLPRAWVLEKLGIDISKYEPQAEVQLQGNDALVNISGRQQQNLLRIVRLFTQGKLSKNQAAIQLQAYGFTTEQINQYLGVEEQFSADDDDEYLANMFAECGYNRDEFDIVSSSSYDGSDDEHYVVHESFADYTEREMNVLELLKKQPNATNLQIAEALKIENYIIANIVDKLTKEGVIKTVDNIRKVTERIPAKQLPEIKVVYTYEKRSIAKGPTLLPTSRKFCVRLVALSESGKVWSIKNIQDISQRVGYSVFKRCGGYWNNNGVIEYQCRHEWVKHIVIKKQK
jgi:hypothetical protein